MSPAELHDRLTRVEVSSRYDPDCRRIIGEERQALGIATQRLRAAQRQVSHVAQRYPLADHPELSRAVNEQCEALDNLSAVAAEAERVAAMWGVL